MKMHWIVNSNLTKERGYEVLIDYLDKINQPYTLVRKPPFVDYLISIEDNLDSNGDHIPLNLDISGPIFVTGTTSMRDVATKYNWNNPGPGYIEAPSQKECIDAWGDHMLNKNAVFGTIKDIIPPEAGDFFVRPNLDSKSFAGLILCPSEFEYWRKNILNIDSWTTLPPETEIMIAPLKKIYKEYRCIIVNGKCVTASQYKVGSRVEYSPDVPEAIIDFANDRIKEYNPRIAVTLDIADTSEGLRIIETNSISSSGFYDIDMIAFADAINKLV